MAAHARCWISALAAVATLAAAALPADATPPFAVGGDARVDPADFEVTVFASGLSYPTSAQLLADGSLLVLLNVPDSGGNLFASSGELHRFLDANDDGVADGPGSALYTGLPGTASSVRRIGSLVFVSSRENEDETISLLRTGATASDPLALLGSIDFDWPFPFGHRNVAVAVRETPGQAGKIDLFFGAGSEQNGIATTGTFSAAGLMLGVPGATSMTADSIYKVTVDDNGASPVLENLVQIAVGVRNTGGLIIEPATGDLYFGDNGAEVVSGGPEPRSADEVNRLAFADIDSSAEDFGFPDDYVEYRTGAVIGGSAVQPLISFQPIDDPQTGDESVGAAEVTFAPPMFPPGLDDGMFVGFHGDYTSAGVANSANPIVYVDLTTSEHFHFVSISETGIGHPNGMLATDDALYVVDLDTDGNVSDAASAGAVYKIRAIAPMVPALPGVWPLILAITFSATAFWLRGRQRDRSLLAGPAD